MKICLCDIIFQINNLYPYIEQYCKNYIYKGSRRAEYTITVSITDISYEREKSIREDRKEGIPVREFSEDYLETLAVYRKICRYLLDKDILLFHGSVVSVDGVGYLFTAKSGIGKSTHTRYWREYFGDRAVMVNDDKPLLAVKEDRILVYGTPWDGKHRLSTNISVPLKAICILHRGSENSICRIDKKEAYPMLLQQTNRPVGDVDGMNKTLELIDKLSNCVELYSLHCTMNKEAARVAYEGMR